VSEPLDHLRAQVDASHVTTTIWRLQRAATQSVSEDEPRSVMLEAARLLQWLLPVLTEGMVSDLMPKTIPVLTCTFAQMEAFARLIYSHARGQTVHPDLLECAAASMVAQLACDVSINGTRGAIDEALAEAGIDAEACDSDQVHTLLTEALVVVEAHAEEYASARPLGLQIAAFLRKGGR
jgi:hypothetical protein